MSLKRKQANQDDSSIKRPRVTQYSLAIVRRGKHYYGIGFPCPDVLNVWTPNRIRSTLIASSAGQTYVTDAIGVTQTLEPFLVVILN